MTSRSIGDVVADLRGEFPELTVSKIRYLEARDVIRPERTSGGQRRFSDDDVSVIRRALRLQRDDYLPLDVIAEQVKTGYGDADSGRDGVPAQRVRRRGGRAMSAAEVCERAGIDESMLDDLRRHGLVDALDAHAVDIGQIVGRLAEVGIEPRHLRTFRTAADRDIALVEQALMPQRASTRTVNEVDRRHEVTDLLALLLDLHIALVQSRSTTLGV